MLFATIMQGFAVGSGLIIAIGPQNAFVISQGIKREHVLLSALICTLTDTLLILIGVVGLGAIFMSHPSFIFLARVFGALFLLSYAILAFHKALNPKVLAVSDLNKNSNDTKKVIMILLSIGLLNPHAYLDTVILIGSLAAQNQGNLHYFFGFGAILASMCWFFTIAFGAQVLTPIFEKKYAWRLLDLIVGTTMLAMAINLIAESRIIH